MTQLVWRFCTPGPKARLLEGLSPRDREIILAAASRRKFSAGTEISTQGTMAERLYVLVKGCARFFYTTDEDDKKSCLFGWGRVMFLAASPCWRLPRLTSSAWRL